MACQTVLILLILWINVFSPYNEYFTQIRVFCIMCQMWRINNLYSSLSNHPFHINVSEKQNCSGTQNYLKGDQTTEPDGLTPTSSGQLDHCRWTCPDISQGMEPPHPPFQYFLFLWKQAWGVHLCSCPTPATRNWPELENFRLLMKPGWKKVQADVKGEEKKRLNHTQVTLGVARFDTHQRHAEQRLQAAIIQLTLPHLHLWVVRTCGGNEKTRISRAQTWRHRRKSTKRRRSSPRHADATEAEEDAHSRRHLKPLCPSSAAPPPRTPSGAAPARRRHGNREPASRWWEVSSCWHSKGTQSWGRSQDQGRETWANSKSCSRPGAAECLTRHRLPWSNAPR